MRAPGHRLLVAWVLKAWEELDMELVKKSFKVIFCVSLSVCVWKKRECLCVCVWKKRVCVCM